MQIWLAANFLWQVILDAEGVGAVIAAEDEADWRPPIGSEQPTK